jgi:Ca2+/Na+ antiporter
MLSFNVALWVGVLPFIWYLKFVMAETTVIEQKKRRFYAWGIIRYCYCALWFTIGTAFFLMNQNDWQRLYESMADNVAKLISVVFWLGFAFFIYYFFVYKYPKEAEKRGLKCKTEILAPLASEKQEEKKVG